MLRALKPEGVAVSHFAFDRAGFAAASRLLEQHQGLYVKAAYPEGPKQFMASNTHFLSLQPVLCTMFLAPSAGAPEIVHRSLGSVAFVFAVAPGHALAGAAQLAGLGVGFLPQALAAGAIARGELIPLRVATPKPQLSLGVAWRATGAGPATQWFVQRLAEMDLTASA